MDTELQQELFSRIDALSIKLGVGAEALWEVLVRQSVTEGIIGVVLFSLFTIFMVAYISQAKRVFTLGKKVDWDPEGLHVAYTVIGGFLSVFYLVFACCDVSGSVMQIVNPEYYAFQDITSILGG